MVVTGRERRSVGVEDGCCRPRNAKSERPAFGTSSLLLKVLLA